MKKKTKLFLRSILKKSMPIWLAVLLTVESSAFIGLAEYYYIKKNLENSIVQLASTTKDQNELGLILKQKVIPQKGYTLAVKWGDVGQLLVEYGAIDETKYKELFADDETALKHMWHLENKSNDHMQISEKGSRFMVNTLWALGLINKSKILDEGQMREQSNGNIMNYASTGGWSLGSKDTSVLYSSERIIPLTEKQEEIVQKIAESIYRPCCDNHTAFPDCNHGMAALGYIQLAVSQGVPEKRIYQDILALNSYWFPQNYLEIAAFFQKKNTDWENVDPKIALSREYSSASGLSSIRQQIQDSPVIKSTGGGCGA